jgi:glycosyltransferase involved in cell wall biosynthesis
MRALHSMHQSQSSRVLILSPQPFYEERGTPIALAYVAQALIELGYQVDFLAYPVGKNQKVSGMRLMRSGNPFGFTSVPIGFSMRKLVLDGPFVAAAFRLIRENDYACIHAVEEAVFAAICMNRGSRSRIIYDMASSLPEQMKNSFGFCNPLSQFLLKGVEAWALKRVSQIICSAGLGEQVKAVAPLTPVQEWYFPVPESSDTTSSEVDVRRQLGLAENLTLVTYTGSFAAYQDMGTVAQAIPRVLERDENIAFLLVGGTSAEVEKLRMMLPMHVMDRVRILPRQAREDMPSYIAAASILLSTREDGGNIPLKVFEYLAAGKPIIATDIPAHRSVLTDDLALLCKPGPEGICEAIAVLTENPERAQRLGKNAAEFARTHLSWETFRDSLGQIYKDLELNNNS